MRHRVAGKRLSRSTGNRRGLRRALVNDLFRYERITTTEAKARAIRPQAEKLITLAKRGLNHDDPAREIHARRLARARTNNSEAVTKLFGTLAPRYEERAGGYTRMLKLGRRKGDSAEMVILELVDREDD